MSNWNVNHYITAAWRWAWLILLVTVVAVSASLLVSSTMTKTYRATATVLTGEDNTNPKVTTDDYVLSQRLASGYAGLATRQIILEEVVKSLGLNTDWQSIQQNILVAPVPNTSLLDIRVSDSDPRRAAAIANEIARQLLVHSPTEVNQQDLQQRQAFTKSQLDDLQSNIQAAQASIAQKQAALDTETSARAVTDLNDQIKALQTKITGWRAEYEKLLGDMPTKSPNTMTIVQTAVPPTQPVSPNIPFNAMLAGFAGIVLSTGTVLLIEYLRAGKIYTLNELGEIAGAPGLVSITRIAKRPPAQSRGLLAVQQPHSPIAEQFRVLRSNVRFAWAASEPLVLLITSAGIGEGKSTISANLAASFARAGKQTILVDADLRHPTLHFMFGLTRELGLTSLLSRSNEANGSSKSEVKSRSQIRDDLAGALVETEIANLAVLSAGPPGPTNPGELLASPSMVELLEILRHSADVIIIDSPPTVPVSDTAVLASLDVGVLIVAESDRTSIKAVNAARESLERAQARVLGTILNKARRDTGPYYSYEPEQQPAPRSRVRALTLSGKV